MGTDVDALPRLGELLASKGLVSHAQLAQALDVQQQFGGRLGTNLVELGILTEEQIARCLSEHIGMPFYGAETVANLAADTIARVPVPVARRFRCVPLFGEAGTLWLGVADHATAGELAELSAAVQAPVSLALITELTLSYALDRYYGIRREVRGLRLAGVVDKYRWLSDASGRLCACTHFDEIVALLGGLLAARFGSSATVSDEPPSEPLRSATRPQWEGTTLLCPIRDHLRWRAVIRIGDVAPAFGDVELIQVLLEFTAHAISMVEARAKADKGAQLAESLGRYVSDNVVKELKRDEDFVLFNRKHEVSVLFADIRGFTTVSEHLDPDLTVLMLNTFFAEMSATISQFGGTLDKFIGDGLMAFWGAPTTTPDFAALAVRAAIEMQARMPRVNRKMRRLQIDNAALLTIGVGICTGLVLVGNMGTRQLMQYTAIGDVVNVAARLCGRAAGGEILVDDNTAARVLPEIRAEPRGPITVKGRTEPVIVHCVV